MLVEPQLFDHAAQGLVTARVERAADQPAHQGERLVDRHGRVVAWNPAATRMFGYTLKDVLGQQLSALIIPAADRDARMIGAYKWTQDTPGGRQPHVIIVMSISRSRWSASWCCSRSRGG